MASEGLINVCQAVAHGNSRKVRNIRTNEQGTAISVEGNRLKVLVEESAEVWACEDCKEQATD